MATGRGGASSIARVRVDPARGGSSHSDEIVHRLRRIEGQVAGIRRMYEEGRYCIDVLDQLSAARAGLESAALEIIEDHVNGCVRQAMANGTGEQRAAELLSAAAELRAAIHRFVRSV